jgi:hypothetical protein
MDELEELLIEFGILDSDERVPGRLWLPTKPLPPFRTLAASGRVKPGFWA